MNEFVPDRYTPPGLIYLWLQADNMLICEGPLWVGSGPGAGGKVLQISAFIFLFPNTVFHADPPV